MAGRDRKKPVHPGLANFSWPQDDPFFHLQLNDLLNCWLRGLRIESDNAGRFSRSRGVNPFAKKTDSQM
jgi:hypothetical protein